LIQNCDQGCQTGRKIMIWGRGLGWLGGLMVLAQPAIALEPWQQSSQLDGTETTLTDGSFYDVYSVEWQAGEQVWIGLSSEAFDTYLLVTDGQGTTIARNDDSNGSDSRLIFTVPRTGTYRIIATSYIPGAKGAYTLQWRLATEAEMAHFATQQTADRLVNEANALLQRSQFDRALQLLTQAQAGYQQIGNRRGEIQVLTHLAGIYYPLGQYRQGIEASEDALAIAREIAYPLGEASALGNLGVIYMALGQYEASRQLQTQALAIYRQLNHQQGMATSLLDLGLVDIYRRHIPEAIAALQEALVICDERDDQVCQAKVIANLGIAYSLAEQYSQAIAYHHQAWERYQAIGDPRGAAGSLLDLGTTYMRMGNSPQAIATLEEALTQVKTVGDRPRAALVLNNLGAIFYHTQDLEKSAASLQAAIDLLTEIRQALGASDRNKISIFEEQLRTYLLLQRTLVAQNRPEQALAIADRSRAQSLVDFLTSQSATAPSPLNASELQQVVRDQQATAVVYSQVQDWLYVWVIPPQGEIALRRVAVGETTVRATTVQALGSAASLVGNGRGIEPGAVGEWAVRLRASVAGANAAHGATPGNPPTEAAASPAPGSPARESPARESPARESPELGLGGAYQRLIEPIADLLPRAPGARLIIVPDRELALVPWAALRNPTDDSRLIDRYTLTLAPSLQTLRETHRRRQTLPTGTAPLVIGNPAPMPNHLEPLPGSEREAIAIAQTQSTSPLIGAAATETAVKQSWHTARALHFATHGDPGWLALTPDRANDGLLTVAEIFNSQLQAEMVVMSACNTGKGDITGEGIIGLARAFLKAGSPTVVATLWKVPDEVTAFLMGVFYRELAAGATKAAALRTAQLETRDRYPHPVNWAAFMLIGEAD
jgi:tetratricopeptide (TPR) repeat protein